MKLDLHTHSKYSDDSLVEPRDIVRLARERGMDGTAVTDHLSVEGGMEARAWASRNEPGFLVIPGIEYATEVGHIVGLFVETEPSIDIGGKFHGSGDEPSWIDQAGLNSKPPSKSPLSPDRASSSGSRLLPAKRVVDAVHAAGGIAVLAHPYELRLSLPEDLFPSTGLDALEGFNGRADSLRNPRANAMAQGYARRHGIPMVGGSDAHFAWEIARAGCEIEALTPGAPTGEVKRAIIAGLAVPFGITAPRTANPRTSFVKMRKSGRYAKAPKTVARLFLGMLGAPGLWLENLLSRPLEK